MRVIIVGTGDMAHGLGNMFYCNGKTDNHYEVFATEPLPDANIGEYLIAEGDTIPILSLDEALETGDMLIMCIPSKALKHFLRTNFSKLKEGSILVDCTNSKQTNDDLAGTLDSLGLDVFTLWVKAYNDNGAVNLLQQKPNTKTVLVTEICGPDKQAVKEVAEFTAQLGLSPRVVPMQRFDKLRGSQETIGAEWIHSAILMTVLFCLTFLYVILAAWQRPSGFEWYQLPTRYCSKAFAWTATYGFALSLLPGVLARLIKQLRGPRARISRMLLWGLGIRKHVGILALYFVFLHACLMLLTFGSEYFGFMLNDSRGKMRWTGEASMLFGVISISFFSIVGIASLPSVGAVMNKAQATLVFGPLVWLGLMTALAHIMILGVESWSEKDENLHVWPGDMPPVTLMASLIPLLVLLLKFIQVTITISQAFLMRRKKRNSSTGSDHSDSDSIPVTKEGPVSRRDDSRSSPKRSMFPAFTSSPAGAHAPIFDAGTSPGLASLPLFSAHV
jgi:predicted dinucleotide-binding enzyme